MNKLFAALAVATVLVALSGCHNPTAAAWYRSDVVKSCRNGAIITRDPEDGRLIYYRSTGWESVRGYVAAGVNLEDVCDAARR